METYIFSFIAAMGLPSAICGLIFWQFKRHIEKIDAEKKQHDENVKAMMLNIMQENRANYVLIEATARAVQRIPDANCNGDMTAALAEAQAIQMKGKNFLVQNGIEHIFGD